MVPSRLLSGMILQLPFRLSQSDQSARKHTELKRTDWTIRNPTFGEEDPPANPTGNY